MAIRVDIDAQDLSLLRKETGKRFDRQTMLLAASCAIITFIAATAIFVFWRALHMFAAARAEAAPINIAIAALALSAMAFALSIVVAFMLRKSRRKLDAATRRDSAKPGLTTGRFEFYFTEKALIAKGAQATRKINWAGLDRIAETKSMIVFWRRGEVFAFLPKAGLADGALYEKLVRIHGPAVSNTLSNRHDAGADPHKITFESTRLDYAEYRQLYADRLDGWASFFRRMLQWAPWPTLVFFSSLAAAIFATYSFVVTLSIGAGALAIVSALTAAAVFYLNAEIFRGPAHPRRKGPRWPFAQSELVSVTLFDSGVCVSRGESEETYPWTAFDRIVICPLTAYLALTAQIVLPAPKRAFADKVHFRAFTDHARAQMKNAHAQAAAHKKARLARQLSPGVKHQSKKRVKALPAPAPTRSLPPKTAPKALPPSAEKSSRSALDAVRSAAKARVNLNQAV